MRLKDLVTGQSSYCDSVAEKEFKSKSQAKPFIYLFFSCEATSLSTCLPVLLIIWEYIFRNAEQNHAGRALSQGLAHQLAPLAHQGKKSIIFPWARTRFYK